MSTPHTSWLSRVIRAVLGEFHYEPPAWARRFGRRADEQVHAHAGRWALLLVFLGVAYVVGMQTWKWWQAHQPQARTLVETREAQAKLTPPGATLIVKGKAKPQPVVLSFTTATAKLEAVGKAATGVTLEPAHAGQWQWTNDKTLTFTPSQDWPAGKKYVVQLDPKHVAPSTKLPNKQWDFSTAPLQISVSEAEFNIDPRDPTLQRVVVGYQSNYPLDKALLEQSVRLEVVGGSKIFDWKGQAPDALFQVVEGKNQREFWVRTTRIQIPEAEDFVKVTLAQQVASLTGGQPMAKEVTTRVRIPDPKSGFFIDTASAEILRTEEGEPEQFLFIDTRGFANTAEVQKHLAVWQEPENFLVKDATGKKVPPGANDISEELLRQFAPVTLKAVELELSEGQAATTRHAFKFLTERSGRLFVRVTRGVVGMGGFVLDKEYRNLLNTPTFPKEVQLQGKGGVLALNGERKLSLQSRGVSHLRVGMARVPARQVNHLVVMTEGDFASPSFMLPGDFDESNLARFLRKVQPVAMKNEYQACYSVVDFAPALQTTDASDTDASRGLFFLTAEGVEPTEESQKRLEGDVVEDDWQTVDEAQAKRFVLVTDLGLMVKKNADGSRDVFVQSIQKGEPVNGVSVTVLAKNGEYLLQQTTVDGHVHFESIEHLQREKRPVAIVASLGNDLAFLPFQRPDRLLDFSRFDVGGVLSSQAEALEAFLFTERGVYRPGDEVHLGAVVKRRDWGGGVAGLPLEVEIKNSQDTLIDNQTVVLSEDGFLDLKTKLDEAEPTGRYTAEIYLAKKDDDEERIRLGRVGFRVEDFQPDRMKLGVTLSGDAAAGWLQPKAVVADVKLESLFGFPAAKRVLKARMELNPGDFAFEAYPEYTFHNRLKKPEVDEDDTAEAGQKVNLGEQQTDEAGKAQFNLDLERFDQSCFQVNLLVEGFEADGGRSVRSGKTFRIAALPYVVGYKAEANLGYLSKDAEAPVQFLALDPALKPTAPANLSARVMQIRHVSVLTRQESGSYAYISTARESVISEARFALPVEGARQLLPTNTTGEFRFELVNADNQVVCACPFTVVGKGDAERSLERDTELGIKLARAQWQSGESLEASVNAAYTGAGLMTVERDRVLGWQWFKAGTPTSVQNITVPADLEGSAYVNASFVRSLDSPEIFTSPLSYAVAHFTANPNKRKLAVEVDAPTLVKPGEVLKIGFKTDRPSRIAIYAVDAGIHQITDYPLPDPLAHLNRQRALEVETEQLMDLILPEFSLVTKHKAYGGDSDKPLRLHLNPFKRRKEPPVVFWSGLVEAGPERREVSYTVPDYFAGKLNIMAVAVAADATGQAQTSSTVRGPLVLTPNVPFFAAPGDEFVASLTVANNLEGADAQAPITLSATVTPHLKIVAAPEAPLQIPTGQETTVRFRVAVQTELGGAEIRFTANVAGQTVNRSATLSVRPAVPFVTQVQSGWFRTGVQDVPVARQMYPQFRKLEATASALPVTLTQGLAGYLREYPYGCTEQITSRAVARLVLADDAAFGFDPAESAQQLNTAFALLRSRQGSSGGFGYWDSGAGDGLDYLTTYVARFLIEAHDAGRAVPADLLDETTGRLRQMARVQPTNLDEAAVHAAAIYLLTRRSENTSTLLLNLRDMLRQRHPDTWQGHLTAAYVAGSYALLKQQKEGLQLMQNYWAQTRKAPRPQGGAGENFYRDAQVQQAEGFAVVCRHFPEMASQFGYDDLKVVTEPLTQNRFNTISAATSILALKAYSVLAKQVQVKVGLSEIPRAGDLRPLAPETDGLLKAGFTDQAKALRFQIHQEGGADLGAFYQVVAAGFDLALPTQRNVSGLEVQRVILNEKGEPVEKLKVGTGATVELRVRNVSPDPQSHIAVLDLLPGSFELEPNGLKPGKNSVPGADFVDVREDRNLFFCGLKKGEMKSFSYRIKPMAAGTFVIPPAFAEAMYDRGLNGQDVGGKVVVE